MSIDLGRRSDDSAVDRPGAYAAARATDVAADGDIRLVAQPEILDFGEVYVGASKTLSLTLTNVGTSSTRVLNVRILDGAADGFTLVENTCVSLAPGQSCRVSVRFAPPSPGPKSAILLNGSGGTGGGAVFRGTGRACADGGVSCLEVRSMDGGAADRSLGQAAACTSLSNSGAAVLYDAVASPRPSSPQPQGGMLLDGVYELTSFKVYNVDPATVPVARTFRVRNTLRLSGNAALLESVLVTETPFAPPREERVTNTFRADGARATTTRTCPERGGTVVWAYTATPTEFIYFVDTPDGNVTAAFRRR